MINISTRVRVNFAVYLLDCQSFDYVTRSTNACRYEKHFQEKMFMIGKTGPQIQALFNLPKNHN